MPHILIRQHMTPHVNKFLFLPYSSPTRYLLKNFKFYFYLISLLTDEPEVSQLFSSLDIKLWQADIQNTRFRSSICLEQNHYNADDNSRAAIVHCCLWLDRFGTNKLEKTDNFLFLFYAFFFSENHVVPLTTSFPLNSMVSQVIKK